MLLGACLVPLAVSGLVDLRSGDGGVETTGSAVERAAPGDDEVIESFGSTGTASPDGRAPTAADRGAGSTTGTRPATTTETTNPPGPTTTTTAAPDPPPSGQTTTTAEPQPPSQAEAVIDLVNAVRSDVGCAPLAVEEPLEDAAQLHAEDMSERSYMDHVNPEGMDPSARAAAQGHDGGVGENIAMGYPDAEAVMDGWMSSPGHRANIENCDYQTIGVGLDGDGWYWTQVFGL